MAKQLIKVEVGSVKKMRGKSEYHMKPCASALGVTSISYNSPIRNLLGQLLEEGKIAMTDDVEVFRGEMQTFLRQTVSQWMDGSAIGMKPGSRPWLRKSHDEGDEDE